MGGGGTMRPAQPGSLATLHYCAIKDVQDLTQLNFTQVSRPTESDVIDMIARIAAEIDGVCQAAGYVVPITATQAVAMLRTYNTMGAAVMAWHAGYVSDTLPARVEYWERTYRDFLTRIRNGQQQLPGESASSDEDIDFAIAPTLRRDNYWSRPPGSAT